MKSSYRCFETFKNLGDNTVQKNKSGKHNRVQGSRKIRIEYIKKKTLGKLMSR